jgi:hypothetical protein
MRPGLPAAEVAAIERWMRDKRSFLDVAKHKKEVYDNLHGLRQIKALANQQLAAGAPIVTFKGTAVATRPNEEGDMRVMLADGKISAEASVRGATMPMPGSEVQVILKHLNFPSEQYRLGRVVVDLF